MTMKGYIICAMLCQTHSRSAWDELQGNLFKPWSQDQEIILKTLQIKNFGGKFKGAFPCSVDGLWVEVSLAKCFMLTLN